MITLAEIEHVPLAGEGGIDWLPLRAALGLTAFGVNAWTARDAGAEVIGPHVETDDQAAGDEELYVVWSGRARFRVGDDEFETARGAFVSVTDAAVERSAIALEPDTTILAFGGRAGAHGVAAWEFIVRANARYRRGDFAGAVADLEPALALHPTSSTVLYDLACYEARAGAVADALAHLRGALELNEALRDLARDEPDFESLRTRPEFGEIVA